MSDQLSLEMFRQSPLSDELQDAECRVLMDKLTTRTLRNNEVLLQEGHSDNRLYGIYEGSLAITRDTGGGDWIILHVLKAGTIAGELGFIDGRGHSATLRALGTTRVYCLEREQLEALLVDHPHLVYKVMRAIVRTVHDIVVSMNTQYVELNNYISKQHGRY